MSRRIWRRGRLLGAGAIVVAALAGLAVACGGGTSSSDKTATAVAGAPPTQSAAPTQAAAPTMPAAAATPQVLGETPGWGGGKTATVFYTKQFYCDKSPCEAGSPGMNPPGVSSPVPSVWVLVPLFSDTAGLQFHCPTAGNCVAHPMQLDVSQIGLGTVIPLPPHSHIVDPTEAGFSTAGATPWKVVVVGIKTRAAWNMLEQGKSLTTLRQVQADTANATKDLPSDIVLFFGIK